MAAFVLSSMINLHLTAVFLTCSGVKIRAGSVWSEVCQGIFRPCVERMTKFPLLGGASGRPDAKQYLCHAQLKSSRGLVENGKRGFLFCKARMFVERVKIACLSKFSSLVKTQIPLDPVDKIATSQKL